MANPSAGLIDPAIFESLQAKIDDDTAVRDQIRDITQTWEKQEKVLLSALANAPTSTTGDVSAAVNDIETRLLTPMLDTLASLAALASRHPYYKFNHMWSRQMQDAVFAVVLAGWLGGLGAAREGGLLSIERVGEILRVPVNIKDTDTFHLTVEEYLQGLISLVEELARLARNSVTQGNYARPLVIAGFVKDVHAGFQLLNLKNDALRRRSDGVKYKVREVEDVVYDLSLRDLVPRAA